MSTKSSPSKISWPSSTSSSSRRSSGGLNGFSRQSPDSVSCLVSNDHVHLPRELPCRHQVCMVFVKAKADQNQLFTCPSCSEIFRLGKNGNVDELANNFRYDEKAGLLELASDLAALSPNQGSSGHPSDGIWSNTNGADVAKQSNKNEKNTSHVKQHLSGYSYQFQSDFSANQVLGPMFNAPNTSLANGWQAMHEIGATNHLGLNGASFLANLNLGLASSVMISPTKLVKKSEFCSCQSVNEGASSGNPVMPSGNPVTSFCRQCDEDLCEVCVGAHKRVTLTRNHLFFESVQSAMSRRGGTAGGSKKTSNIQFNRPSEPSFLKRIKEQVGYKEAVTIESKRSLIDHDEVDDREDRDDEQPQIVALKEGDLTAEQFRAEKDKNSLEENDQFPSDGRMLFKKPSIKREQLVESLSPESEAKISKEKKKKKDKKNGKSLLSFEEDDE